MKSPYIFKFDNKYTEEQFNRVEKLLSTVNVYFKDIGYYFISSIDNKNDADFQVIVDYWTVSPADDFIPINVPMRPIDRRFNIKFNKDETDEEIMNKLEKANEKKINLTKIIHKIIEKVAEQRFW